MLGVYSSLFTSFGAMFVRISPILCLFYCSICLQCILSQVHLIQIQSRFRSCICFCILHLVLGFTFVFCILYLWHLFAAKQCIPGRPHINSIKIPICWETTKCNVALSTFHNYHLWAASLQLDLVKEVKYLFWRKRVSAARWGFPLFDVKKV